MNFKIESLLTVAASALLVGTLIMGCKDTGYPDPQPTSAAPNTSARFLFVNVAPDAPALNFLVENVAVGQALVFGQVSTAYVPAQVGAVQLRAKAASGTLGGVIGSNDILFRAGTANQNNFAGVAGGAYTVFVTDTLNRPRPTVTGGTNPGGPQLVVATDPLTQTLTAGSGGVRFFHLAPDVGAVSLRLVPTSPASVTAAANFANRAFRTVTANAFTSVPAATYTAQVFSGTAVPPLSSTIAPVLSMSGVTVEATKLYTLYAQGLARRRNLSVGRIQHN